MKFSAFSILAVVALLFNDAAGQQPAASTPTPSPISSTPAGADDPQSVREHAIAKLMEGQRHLWKSQRMRSQAGRANSMKLAKAAFERAIELDGSLAEAYTVLSEIAVTLAPADLDEATRLAAKAVSIDRGNFGGQRMLARLYTIKSRLNSGTLVNVEAEKAVAAWREVVRIDGRNAEAWAFLSAFAEALQRPTEHLEALRSWVSSAPPLDVQFYARVMGGGASLNPESASIKLAATLAAAGKREEAASILSTLISDNAENEEAIAMLADLVESTEGAAAATVTTALQQAIFAHPENVTLIDILARHHVRLGRPDEGITLLRRHISSLSKTDSRSASVLQVSLGDIYFAGDKLDDAIRSYESAIKGRGLSPTGEVSADEREFGMLVVEKLVQASKLADRPAAARSVIERSRQLFGKDDPFADRQLVALLQSIGERKEALALVRSVRSKRPVDQTLLRMEATLLADLGQVEAAVAIIRNRRTAAASQSPESSGSEPVAVRIPPADEFSDLLFIANLYNRAGRPADAITAANTAFDIAGGRERRQIAKMALASAQKKSGDHVAAESTLRGVLKETPSNPIALNNLGYFLVERGERLEEAVEMINRAVKTDPRNGTFLDSLGWAYFKLGKADLAEKYLRDAARADADSATIMEHLGDVLFERKDLEKAKWAWRRALRLTADAVQSERLKKKIGK